MTQSLDAAVRAFEPALPLGVAFSGGADSTALLMACAIKWPGQVVALHVNHGLQAAATDFEAHSVDLCTRMNVPLRVLRVDAKHAPGQSPEDAARIARYKAFSALALVDSAQIAIKSIAIAQHADDQVETLLLALSRGAGLRGLSAMPAQWVRDGLDFYRPLLRVSAAHIREWLAERAIPFVEDPTNTDQRFTRNRIRAQLLPALDAVFPTWRDTFTRSAAHAAQAQGLLDDMAIADLQLVCRSEDGLPTIKGLQTLAKARQGNVLRYWFAKAYGVIPSAAQLAELQHQIAACVTRGHRIHLKVAQGFVERRGGGLAWRGPLEQDPPAV
ncbi:tRNA lysidine(34) synthetase TilS [Rhodoferax sp. TH121]|uniref:tRNA lysidine(34) synthetase TilS n=1 Tax=Rhodoferax sp. TH121 TaxID=2022803 RepID=UPI000B97371B|nr:tRNA lysidine(34) synthetase TilS [Rhodoferax sp. TH121]OYQ41195.1 tRNA lysidine(34) synthetase TilS [Rhodoferax sp. TH121]